MFRSAEAVKQGSFPHHAFGKRGISLLWVPKDMSRSLSDQTAGHHWRPRISLFLLVCSSSVHKV